MAPQLRPSIHSVLLETAVAFSTRSTCSRLHVGSVIARDGRIISTGYNGAPHGMPHCEHPGPLRAHLETPCEQAVHAEANAICFAAKHGLGVEGAAIYCTHAPCLRCSTMLVNSGIQWVYYINEFRDMAGIALLRSAGIVVNKF